MIKDPYLDRLLEEMGDELVNGRGGIETPRGILNTPDPIWTLESALGLVRQIQAEIRQHDYHVLLGGGVLNTGESAKDLDLFFVPLNGSEGKRAELVKYLARALEHKSALRDAPDYGDSIWHWETMKKFTFQGKRIDVFILK